MQTRRKYRVNWFRVITISLSCYFIYLTIGQQYQLNAIGNETQAIQLQQEQAKQMNVTLKAERDALNDPRYVEKVARAELGLVKPGETPYIEAGKK